jgi:hypothetical protein
MTSIPIPVRIPAGQTVTIHSNVKHLCNQTSFCFSSPDRWLRTIQYRKEVHLQQLNIFDFYNVQDKKAPTNQLHKVLPKPVKRRLTLRKKLDLIISIDKKGRFFSDSELGIVKRSILNHSGATYIPELDSLNIVEFVRGDQDDQFRKLEESTVSFVFSSEAEKKIKDLRKEYKRRNIALKVEVTEVSKRV